MNILFISHEKELNGASLSLIALINEIKYGNEIFVLTSSRKGPFISELKKNNIKYIYKPYFRWMTSHSCANLKWIIKKVIFNVLGYMNYISAHRLKKFIVENKIDIIHSNSSVINIGGILSNMYDVPHVWHIREFGKEDFNMEFVYNEKKCLKFIRNNSSKIICISKAIQEKYEPLLGKDKCELIYNGISEEFLNKKTKKQNHFFNMLIAGRLEEAKGQTEAILAINELVKEKKDNFKLYIAGSGNQEEGLKSMVREYNLDKYIEFSGRVSDMKSFRENMDIELVCSKKEAFGRVTIEAMMSGNPVIGANTGGTKELVIDGYNGYLYNQGSYKDLAKKLVTIMGDQSKFGDMREKAYNYSKENFTSKVNAEKIFEVYKKLLEE